MTDVATALLFGVIGYLCSQLRYSRAAMLIGFVLGHPIEYNLNLALEIEGWLFVLYPVPLAIISFATLFVVYLSNYLGTEFMVENVRGGSGAKAMARLANAPADGSIFYGTTPTFINTSLLSKPDHTYEELMGVVNFFLNPQVIYVRAESTHKKLADLVEEARAKPGSVLLGVGSPGSLDRQAMEQLKLETGIAAPVITHDGGGELLISVLNGTVTAGVGEIQELSAQLEAGQVRLITVLTEERIDKFPDVMTGREQGIDLIVNKFRGIAGPRKLPRTILVAWENAVAALLEDAEFKAWYTAQGLVPLFMTHEAYAVFLDDFAAQQRAFFHEFGILAD